MTDRRSSTARSAVGMGVITAVSRALGFVRVLVVLVVLGTTYLGNAFNSANMLANILFELLAAGALSAVLVPTFVNLLEKGSKKEAEQVAGGVLGVALVVLGGVVLVGVLAAGWLAQLLTLDVDPATEAEQRELVTYLLRFFLPQVMLYAAGTVATAVLYAHRRFAVTAAAPIGNTLVMVACLVAFRMVAGPDPGLDLGAAERWLLVAAGTGGVVAFVGSLLVACAVAGFRLRPRWPGRDRRVAELLRHAGWGVALHTAGGMLLGAAVVAGNAVEGGVAAYQFAWVVFLAPYGILAQPIHTAVLPELVTEAREHGMHRVALSLRWSLERIALFVLPVTAAMMALAEPAMRLVQFGGVTDDGVGLLAAALAGLAVGLYGYSALLLLARGYYALDNSRTPGLVAVACGAGGVVMMLVSMPLAEGAGLIGVLGLSHSLAYSVGALVLAVGLGRRAGVTLWTPVLGRMTLVAVVAGLTMWATVRWLESGLLSGVNGKPLDVLLVLAGGCVGGLVVLVGFRAAGVVGGLTQRQSVASAVGDDRTADDGTGDDGTGDESVAEDGSVPEGESMSEGESVAEDGSMSEGGS